MPTGIGNLEEILQPGLNYVKKDISSRVIFESKGLWRFLRNSCKLPPWWSSSRSRRPFIISLKIRDTTMDYGRLIVTIKRVLRFPRSFDTVRDLSTYRNASHQFRISLIFKIYRYTVGVLWVRRQFCRRNYEIDPTSISQISRDPFLTEVTAVSG